MGLDNLFAQWEAAGIFAYALPFLLIFAIIFGILTKINIFGTKDNPNKKINAIISLVIALISIQFNFVSSFFSDLFPRFGIGLAVILVILISIGLFVDLDNKKMKWVFGGLLLIVLIAILWVPLGNLGFKINFLDFFDKNFGWIFFLLLVLALVIWATAGGNKNSSQSPKKSTSSEKPSQ